MKISYPDHCGNSPKKSLLIKIYEAVTIHDDAFIMENLDDKIILKIVGDSEISGKESIIKTLKLFIDKGLSEIHINDVITHGNTAAIYGSAYFNNSSQIEFCDVYKFNGFGKKAKIKEIRSFLINLAHHKIL